MNRYVTVKWNYSPKDYIDELFVGEDNRFSIKIDNGEISAKIPALIHEKDPTIIKEISSRIEDLFTGAQVISQMPYNLQLSNYTTYIDRENGKQDVSIAVSAVSASITGQRADIRLVDSDRKVISDTRAERNKERNRFALLSGKFRKRDKFVRSILDSFNKSIIEPNHSLIHLYDILEALKKKFGNEVKLKRNLDISDNRIRKLRILSNKTPLIEGRHVGFHAENLRKATDQEIMEARDIAKELIFKYLTFLEAQDLFSKE